MWVYDHLVTISLILMFHWKHSLDSQITPGKMSSHFNTKVHCISCPCWLKIISRLTKSPFIGLEKQRLYKYSFFLYFFLPEARCFWVALYFPLETRIPEVDTEHQDDIDHPRFPNASEYAVQTRILVRAIL